MAEKSWVFLNKTPQGYQIYFSKDILKYVQENDYNYFKFIWEPSTMASYLSFRHTKEEGYVSLRITNGSPNVGKMKGVFQNKGVHDLFHLAGFIKTEEYHQEVYGERVFLNWDEEWNKYVVEFGEGN
jgi:hypothetical protein